MISTPLTFRTTVSHFLILDEIYRHDYMIYDKHKVLPTHLVQFRIAPEH